MSFESRRKFVREIKEKILWKDFQTVGTTKITTVLTPSPRTDMYSFTCGKEDVTGIEDFLAPAGTFVKGDIAEIIIQKKIVRDAKWHDYPPVKVFLRLFEPQKYGKFTKNERKSFSAFDPEYVHANKKNPFYNRAFYRRFIEGAKETLGTFPDPGI